MNGSVAELNAINGIPTTVAENMAVAEQLGGLEAIGGPKMDNMYHSAWAWAGDSAPSATRSWSPPTSVGHVRPMVISWPKSNPTG